MIGVTTIVSYISGILGGVIPDIVKEVRESRDADREERFMRLQHEFQMERLAKEANTKEHEAEALMTREEMQASTNALVAAIQQPAHLSGVAWIDALNAMIRPVTAISLLGLVLTIGVGFTSDVIDREQFSAVFLVGVESVLGFYFGSRTRLWKAKD